VPDAVIEEIRKREAEIIAKPEPQSRKPGAIVRIKGGPLDDRLGLCTSVRSTTATVLLLMFGTERKLRFDRAAIEAV
jgi:hypothetical protein